MKGYTKILTSWNSIAEMMKEPGEDRDLLIQHLNEYADKNGGQPCCVDCREPFGVKHDRRPLLYLEFAVVHMRNNTLVNSGYSFVCNKCGDGVLTDGELTDEAKLAKITVRVVHFLMEDMRGNDNTATRH